MHNLNNSRTTLWFRIHSIWQNRLGVHKCIMTWGIYWIPLKFNYLFLESWQYTIAIPVSWILPSWMFGFGAPLWSLKAGRRKIFSLAWIWCDLVSLSPLCFFIPQFSMYLVWKVGFSRLCCFLRLFNMYLVFLHTVPFCFSLTCIWCEKWGAQRNPRSGTETHPEI